VVPPWFDPAGPSVLGNGQRAGASTATAQRWGRTTTRPAGFAPVPLLSVGGGRRTGRIITSGAIPEGEILIRGSCLTFDAILRSLPPGVKFGPSAAGHLVEPPALPSYLVSGTTCRSRSRVCRICSPRLLKVILPLVVVRTSLSGELSSLSPLWRRIERIARSSID